VNEWEWRLLEDRPSVESVPHPGGELRAGTRVRLRPRPSGSDAMDLLLAGKTAIVESIEQDYEGAYHVAVVVEDDPGRDLGFLRQPGHRFFYTPAEVELCPLHAEAPASAPGSPRDFATEPILVAGIGNIFLGDDGFGVEVARRLLAHEMPPGVRVVDYGIRSLDLAYALLDAPGVTILVDACDRGEPPGTLFVIEPNVDSAPLPGPVEAHAMHPALVMQMASSMGSAPKPVLVLGCQPETFGPEEGQLGLSERVSAVVDDAVETVWRLVERVRMGDWPRASAGPTVGHAGEGCTSV
jgi:hydrogenase maturation protease